MKRRWCEDDQGVFPWRKIMSGKGLDIGPGNDPLTCAMTINLPDGGGDDITQILHPCLYETFDFIHASQVLEHMVDPDIAFGSWVKILKPGGWIIATVPDWTLYEQSSWPSRWNKGHQTTWSMDKDSARLSHRNLPGWFSVFPKMNLRLCRLIDTNYNYNLKGVDQTAGPMGVEAFIEFALKKIVA